MKKKEAGFTLIELLVVIAILGILVGTIGVRLLQRPGQAKQTRARADIKNIESALQMFKLDTGRYPMSGEGLQALRTAPGGVRNYQKGGYLTKDPLDPWRNAYIYTCPGIHGDEFDIVSYGGDGVPGGEGEDADIESWDIDKL